MLGGLGIDEHFARIDGTAVTSFLTDALGSTYTLTDATGAVSAQYRYEPYGVATKLSGTASTDLLFTGREDDGTGLYGYRARYYAPSYGRFVGPDPLGLAAGINEYAYSLSNPIRFRDPTGRAPFIDCAKVIADAERAANRLERRLKEYEQAECKTEGHAKAIEQAQNELREAYDKVLRHCGGDAAAVGLLATLARIAAILARLGMAVVFFLPS